MSKLTLNFHGSINICRNTIKLFYDFLGLNLVVRPYLIYRVYSHSQICKLENVIHRTINYRYILRVSICVIKYYNYIFLARQTQFGRAIYYYHFAVAHVDYGFFIRPKIWYRHFRGYFGLVVMIHNQLNLASAF